MRRWGFSVPVEFLTDAQAATYGSYARPPSVAELDRCFLLGGLASGTPGAAARGVHPARLVARVRDAAMQRL